MKIKPIFITKQVVNKKKKKIKKLKVKKKKKKIIYEFFL